MPLIRVSYLSLRGAPDGSSRFAVPGYAMHRESLPVEAYLLLYRAVGSAWDWGQRLHMPRRALSEFLASEACRLYVVRDEALPRRAIGFCEYDAGRLPEVQLVNFGLIREAFGKGIGPALLSASLATIWDEFKPARIWLHTDVKDHPAARGVYERAGFRLDEERMEDPAAL